MTDEQGQPLEDNAALASTADEIAGREDAPDTAPETTDQESQQEPSPAPAPKYRGKTVSELARMHSELEGKLGEQGRELGEMKNQYQQSLWQLQQLQQQLFQQQTARPQQPGAGQRPDQEPPAEWSWDNPTQSVDRRVDTRLDSRLNERLGEVFNEMQRRQALSLGELALDSARTRRPDLFKEGIDNDVRNLVQQGIVNRWIAPESVTRPETYIQAAWQLVGAKQNYAFGKQPPNAVQPSFSETPSAGRPPSDGGEPIALTDEARAMIRSFGEKEEDIVKEIRDRTRRKR